jgi:Bacterial PH domain
MASQAYRTRESLGKCPKFQRIPHAPGRAAVRRFFPRSRAPCYGRRMASRPGEMRMPVSVLAIGVACLLVFCTLVAAQVIFPNKTVSGWTIGIFVVLALMCLPVISAFFVEEHRLSDDGMASRTFAGIRKTVRWSELQSVRYSPAMKWFRLDTRSGTTVRVSIALTGLPNFARLVLSHAPAGAIDAGSRPVLEATAAGRPPSLYR